MSAEAWIELIAIVVTLVLVVGGGMTGVIIALLRRNADGTSRHVEKQSDKQVRHGESIADISARMSAVEETQEKLAASQATMADALQRIVRLEEWRSLSTQRLDEADETAKAVVALGEQNKTVFKRVDQIDDKIDEMRREQAAIPRQTAEMLRSMIRPIQPARAVHG